MRLTRALRFVVLAATLALLIGQASEIGWATVWAARPDSVVFYLAVLAWYAALPVADTWIHGYLWRLNLWRHAVVFAMKRVYNFAVFGYTGEVYLFAWARANLGLTGERAFSAVKDNAVLSGAASNAVTIAIGAAAAAIIATAADTAAFGGLSDAVLPGLAAGVVSLLLVAAFRRRILSLDGAQTGFVLAFHTARTLVTLLLQAVVWWLAAPDVALGVWVILLAGYLVLTRLPFLPNRDLLFTTLAVGLAPMLGAAGDKVAEIMLVTGALTQLLHGLVFIAALGLQARPPATARPEQAS